MKKSFNGYKWLKHLCMFITLLIMSLGAVKVFAAPAKLETGTATKLSAYIGTTSFFKKVLKDGTLIYCYDYNKTVPSNKTLYLDKEMDAGVAYIIANGYPAKTFTSNKNHDYYITQAAMWWYLDDTAGMSNLSSAFKSSSADPSGLRPHIKALVAAAKTAKATGYVTPSLSASISSNKMTLTSGEYVSNAVNVIAKHTKGTYNVSSNVTGTVFVDTNGNQKTTFNENETFTVKLPGNTTATTVTLTITATGTVNKAYRYKTSSSSYQPMVSSVLYPEETNLQTTLNLELTTPEAVKISKQDFTSKQELPGATLIVKNSDGKEIDKWVSTNEPHYIKNLADGTYTLTETIAPNGYVLSTETVTFTIKDGKATSDIVMYNKLKEISEIKISKRDITTGKELPGAQLVLTDLKGNVIDSWTSTNEPHYIKNLADGSYSLTEKIAPKGYALSTEVITFTIKDGKATSEVIMYNRPNSKDVEVPDTASNIPFAVYAIGVAIALVGMGVVMKNVKKNEINK